MKTFIEYIEEEVDWFHTDDEDIPDDFVRWDFHFRRYNKDVGKMMGIDNKRYFTIMLPPDTMLDKAFDAAYRAGLSKGSHQSGSYEVQNDNGIFQHVNDKKINTNIPKKYTFKTWDELEAEEKR